MLPQTLKCWLFGVGTRGLQPLNTNSWRWEPRSWALINSKNWFLVLAPKSNRCHLVLLRNSGCHDKKPKLHFEFLLTFVSKCCKNSNTLCNSRLRACWYSHSILHLLGENLSMSVGRVIDVEAAIRRWWVFCILVSGRHLIYRFLIIQPKLQGSEGHCQWICSCLRSGPPV